MEVLKKKASEDGGRKELKFTEGKSQVFPEAERNARAEADREGLRPVPPGPSRAPPSDTSELTA